MKVFDYLSAGTIVVAENREDFDKLMDFGWVITLDEFSKNTSYYCSKNHYSNKINIKYIQDSYSWKNYSEFVQKIVAATL